jgi:hypothetical protein
MTERASRAQQPYVAPLARRENARSRSLRERGRAATLSKHLDRSAQRCDADRTVRVPFLQQARSDACLPRAKRAPSVHFFGYVALK